MGSYVVTTGDLFALAGMYVLSLVIMAAVTWWATRCTEPHGQPAAEETSRRQPARSQYTTGRHPVVHRETSSTQVLNRVRRGVWH